MLILINATQNNYLVSEMFLHSFGLIIFETKILRSKSIFFSEFPDPCIERFFPQ